MPHDEKLFQRIDQILKQTKAIESKKMFGGIITGKPMKGFIFVEQGGFDSKRDLEKWIDLGLNFTSTLPIKKKKTKKGKRNARNTKRKFKLRHHQRTH